ncbi:hypothetical protein M8C21_000852, partial [Ambrosia artemisiifolia]
MEALKKLYAEMILNTAKQAAARALESERNALCIHHDLCNTKDEATTEAEKAALSQQNRITELDAQLNETERVIIDLRAGIRNARERLEEMKNIHMLQSNRPSKNKHAHFRCSSQCSKISNPAKEITTSGPNSASVIIGNKEPESYKNGYTHRIRAIERNLVDEKSISEEKELIIDVDENISGKCAQFSVDTENKDIKNINGSEAFSINNRVSKDQTAKRLSNSVGYAYAQSNHKLSRFGREKLNLKEKDNGNDAKLTENNDNSACTLRRSIRKRKIRCWDEISSSFKSRASLSQCQNHLANDDNNSCLKYTFSRRHKKVFSSKSDNCSSRGKSFLTDQVRKTPSSNHENKKPNPIEDSSSDSQNMIDIACK